MALRRAGQGPALENSGRSPFAPSCNTGNTSNTSYFRPESPLVGEEPRKEDSAMAKYHARPSNQYRYEHYDPRY